MGPLAPWAGGRNAMRHLLVRKSGFRMDVLEEACAGVLEGASNDTVEVVELIQKHPHLELGP